MSEKFDSNNNLEQYTDSRLGAYIKNICNDIVDMYEKGTGKYEIYNDINEMINTIITNYQRGRKRKEIKKIRSQDKRWENSNNEISKGSWLGDRKTVYQQGQQKFNGSMWRRKFIQK